MEFLKNTYRGSATERAAEKVEPRPLTPKSERPRKSWGSLSVSVQTVRGLCGLTSKCVRKDGHANECWPKEG